MAKVIGLGGVFVKSRDPDALRAWYREMLGMEIDPNWGAMMPNGADTYTVWSAFKADSKYFDPSPHHVMLNLRVEDLTGLLAHLRAKGAAVLDRGEKSEYGAFGYVVDPDGTLLELFEPAAEESKPS